MVGEQVFDELKAAANCDEPFPVGEWYAAAVERFGANAAAGIFHRAGRGGFALLLVQLGEQAGFTRPDFKLLPMQRKILTGLDLLGALLSSAGGQVITVDSDASYYYWRVTGCWHCTEQPGCRYYAGLLQEYMAWLGGGKVFWAEEVECTAHGQPACLFRISKKPLD